MVSFEEIRSGVSTVAHEYPIKRVDLFGSLATGQGTEQSDVDLLVEFQQTRVSLLTLSGLKLRLEEILDSPVDIVRAPLLKDSLIQIEKSVRVYDR